MYARSTPPLLLSLVLAACSQVPDEPAPRDTATRTDVDTRTETSSGTATSTWTATGTGSATGTSTRSDTATGTDTHTDTATGTTTQTLTDTASQTGTGTGTGTDETTDCWDLDLGDTLGVAAHVLDLSAPLDTHAPTCGLHDGPDARLRWTAPSGGRWRVAVTGTSGDASVTAWNDTCETDLGCAPDLATAASWLELDAEAGESFVLVVDAGLSEAVTLGIVSTTLREAACADGRDDDLDGAIDCDDRDCAADAACLRAESCDDGTDEDLDGATDCDDDDCIGDPACPRTETACDDRADDDRDGAIDCADPDCASGPACVERCGNGIDDGDADTLADCADPDCRDATACIEDCTGDIDEDLDGFVDCDDPDCAGDPSCPGGPPPRELCDDPSGNDEDRDDLANCDDPDCETLPPCETVVLPEVCDDGAAADEDGDRLANCGDPDCTPLAACGGTETSCTDGRDEDADGRGDCWDDDCDADAACPVAETRCDDAADDDHDASTDCADSDCAFLAACGGTEDACDDGRDDDADGAVDCADDDCDTASACVEDCTNGLDDDANGDLDCADADCTAAADCQEDCANGVDDRDADTLADCADPACQGTQACPEACTGGIDEDADGATDCDDSSCAPLHLCGGVETACDGGADEDADGLVDCWDPDCRGSVGCPSLEYACDDDSDDDHDGVTDCDDTDCAGWAACGGAETACANLADDDHDGVTDARDPDCNPDDDGDGWFLHGTFDPISGDPVPGTADCDDAAPLGPYVHPGIASDPCNGIDEDCDGTVDEDSALTTYYRDEDGDGYGDPATANPACMPPFESGWVAVAGDCDDGATGASVHPGVADGCDGVDTDCDGAMDDDATFATWYRDDDGDTYGANGSAQAFCATPAGSGWASRGGDCDDTATGASVHPSATDSCDGVDTDCDGAVDDDATFVAWYRDADGDGYGTTASAEQACAAPAASGWSNASGDCDDSAAGGDVHPDAEDGCDGVDTDCDGAVDSDATFVTWYYDADGDTYGATSGSFCATPSDARWIARSGDCDDADNTFVDHVYWRDADGDGYGSEAYPLHACDAAIPSGYAASGSGLHDCYDAAPSVSFTDAQGVIHYADEFHPNAAELCDDYDQDCDGLYDEGLATTAWYYDVDGDGYSGDGYSTTYTGTYARRDDCGDPGAAWVATTGDCYDDLSSTDSTGTTLYGRDFHPGASEDTPCDAHDQDCDGNHYDGPGTYGYQFYDYDGDGYGLAAAWRYTCESAGVVTSDLNTDGVPDAWVAQSGDCNESAASVHPGATDTCDGVDTDCNGQADDDAATTTFYYDHDGDGYGVAYAEAGYTPVTQCADPGAAWVPQAGDCADQPTYTTSGGLTVQGADFHPGAAETCDNYDQDCDTLVDEGLATQTWYLDSDGDGYGFSTSAYPNAGAASILTHCRNPGYTDGPGQGYTWQTSSSDCDESNASVHPGRSETCGNGAVDDNCNGVYDENSYAWYRDADGDGYGRDYAATSCSPPPPGYALTSTDCIDDVTYTHSSGASIAGASVYPGRTETCDGWDNNCNGSYDEGLPTTTYYYDYDGDGYGINLSLYPNATNASVTWCATPGAGWVSNSSDCNESSAAVNPDATEVCEDGTYTDNDCDGQYDEGCMRCYRDADGDGYGSNTSLWTRCTFDPTTLSCGCPSGYTTNYGDCADWSGSINAGAAEDCNDGVDNNCNGSADSGDSACYSCYVYVGSQLVYVCG